MVKSAAYPITKPAAMHAGGVAEVARLPGRFLGVSHRLGRKSGDFRYASRDVLDTPPAVRRFRGLEQNMPAVQEILTELAEMGSAPIKKILLNHGAREPLFGVK